VLAENLTSAQRAREVRLEDVVPVRLGEIQGRRALDFACAVDEDVHLPERSDRSRKQAVERPAVGDVRRDAQRTASDLLDLRCGPIDVIDPTPGRHDIGTRLREPQRERPSDTTGPTENDGDLTAQIEARPGHGPTPHTACRPTWTGFEGPRGRLACPHVVSRPSAISPHRAIAELHGQAT